MLLRPIQLQFIFYIVWLNIAVSVLSTTTNLPKMTQNFSEDHEQFEKIPSALINRTLNVDLEHGEGRNESSKVTTFNFVLRTNPENSDDVSTENSRKERPRVDRLPAFHLLPRSGPFSYGIFHRRDRFYYCGPKKNNSCRSLCYAYGYPKIECGRISCYCTW